MPLFITLSEAAAACAAPLTARQRGELPEKYYISLKPSLKHIHPHHPPDPHHNGSDPLSPDSDPASSQSSFLSPDAQAEQLCCGVHCHPTASILSSSSLKLCVAGVSNV